MAQKRAIAILLHETDSYPRRQRYFIWALCDLWRSEGIEIRVLKGPDGKADADLLIPHIDLTVLPHEYTKAMDRFPRVANRNLSDISKRVISRNLIDSKDAYEGPVIVKTNLNYGGMPEARLCGQSRMARPGFTAQPADAPPAAACRRPAGWRRSRRRPAAPCSSLSVP